MLARHYISMITLAKTTIDIKCRNCGKVNEYVRILAVHLGPKGPL
jgi:hypothetical protein